MNQAQKQAIEIALRVMHSLRIRPGQTEREIANWIKHELNSAGARPAFDIIVASGRRSLDPHARPTNKRIRRGEQVVVDLGANYRGSCSDITRTFFVGEPTGKFLHLYNTVKTAQRLAIKAVKDGAWCRLVDLQPREHIKRHCFQQCHLSEHKCLGDCFIHTTGHGVGRKVHQRPRISLKSRARLKAGMVITIEPGIYIKGWGGIRIEDMVLVTKKGCKILTR
jgi:Xaa-Pro aminopeptidase